jgi:hypothetical protein
VHDNHEADKFVEDSDGATDQGNTSEVYEQPSDDEDQADDDPPDLLPVQQLRRSGSDPVPSTISICVDD